MSLQDMEVASEPPPLPSTLIFATMPDEPPDEPGIICEDRPWLMELLDRFEKCAEQHPTSFHGVGGDHAMEVLSRKILFEDGVPLSAKLNFLFVAVCALERARAVPLN